VPGVNAGGDHRPPDGRSPRRRLLQVAGAGLVAGTVAVAAVATVALTRTPATTVAAPAICEQVFVPAYFYAQSEWASAVGGGRRPGAMILDISGVGAGSAPEAHFRELVAQARAAGVTVLGYSSTADGQRPASQVEADIRNYAAWYGVTGIFLDRVSGLAGQAGYYEQIASYVRVRNPGAALWMNVGTYPQDRQYAAMPSVLVVFEGTYSQYVGIRVPAWAREYPASRFAQTVYATPQLDLAGTLALARQRNAGYVYVTDGVGANPYGALPSYWLAELSAASAGCAQARPQAVR
jgi:Spherulation-specific family 4